MKNEIQRVLAHFVDRIKSFDETVNDLRNAGYAMIGLGFILGLLSSLLLMSF